MKSRQWALAILLTVIPAVAAAQGAKPEPVSADLAALVKAAQTEGETTFYSSAPDNTNKRVAEAFTAKYGIQTRFTRLSSAALAQRHASEAESGNVAAGSVLLAGGALQLAEVGVKNGWLEPIAQAGLPVMKIGEFPTRFVTASTAVVQVTPLVLAYNTDKVKGADVPKEWTDILNPRWKGQYLLPDPKTSDVYYDFWTVLLDKYGESFFTQLRALDPRQRGGALAVVQALGAGEGSFTGPTTVAIAGTVKDKGGPINTVTPDFTTGFELHVLLTARSRSKNPSAARLFVNYVMSAEGNRILNANTGDNSVYDRANMPRQYQAPSPGALARKDQILKLLGVQ